MDPRSFHDLSTDSTGDSRSGSYWQNNRAKDEKEKSPAKPGGDPRSNLQAPNTDLDGLDLTPQLYPTV